MKNIIAKYTMVALAAFTLGACSDGDDETCEKDEICTTTITVCCTSETECKYNVDGTDYATIEEATDNLQCTAERAPDDEKSSAIESLKELTSRAKANL